MSDYINKLLYLLEKQERKSKNLEQENKALKEKVKTLESENKQLNEWYKSSELSEPELTELDVLKIQNSQRIDRSFQDE